MNGDTTKYYVYKTTSGRINIPKRIAKALDWGHGEDIGIIIDVKNGNKGLFLWKREKK